MSALTILSALAKAGMTTVGACAMAGNMQAESGLQSNIAQRGMTSLSDGQYTAAADDGTIDFVHDAVGYGLCQWTYYSRKQNLLNFSKNRGASVGDEATQVQFCIQELQTEHAALWEYLKAATDITEAASKICTEYERPAVNNSATRANYANSIYEQYSSAIDISSIDTFDAEPIEGGNEMSKIETAVQWALNIANDSSHGYSQVNRWGPDYDCSSLVIQAWETAGVPVKTNGASYTGNMRSVFLRCGFSDVTSKVNLATGAGLQRGDVLLNEVNHTALSMGDGRVVHARSSEGNTKTGDQSGNEIRAQGYWNYPWDCVLRYQETSSTTGNNTTGSTTTEQMVTIKVPVLRNGSKGDYVRAAQTLLEWRGQSLGGYGADGSFGPATEAAALGFQKAKGLEVDGIIGPATWTALLK